MARSFRSRGVRVRGARRESMWLFTTTSEVSITAASTAVLAFSLNAAALALRPFTVVRTRMDWYCRSDQVAAPEVWGAALGCAVVSDQASAIGVTAVPTPFTDQGSDLFYVYEQNFGRLEVQSAAGVQEVGRMVKIDSKAMRRVNDDQDLILTIETNTFQPSALSIIGGRMLIKLH